MKKRLQVWVFLIILCLALSLESSFAPSLSPVEYSGQSAIGSGLTQVLGPSKSEIKAQILLKW